MNLGKLQCSTLKAVLLLALTASAMQADVIYTLVGTGLPTEAVAFQLVVSTFVNPPLDSGSIYFTCSQFVSSTNCDSVLVPPNGAVIFSNQSVKGAFSAQVQFDAVDSKAYAFDFPTGALGSPGVYMSGGSDNPGTLTVTLITPEPGTALVMLTGLGLWLVCKPRWRSPRPG